MSSHRRKTSAPSTMIADRFVHEILQLKNINAQFDHRCAGLLCALLGSHTENDKQTLGLHHHCSDKTASQDLWTTRNTFCGTWYLPYSRVQKSIAELCSNFGDSAITKGQIAYFSSRMRQTALFLLPVKNLTSPSCSPTPISYDTQEFWRFGHKYGPNCIFFFAHAQNGLISTSCQKSDVTVVFPDLDFL